MMRLSPYPLLTRISAMEGACPSSTPLRQLPGLPYSVRGTRRGSTAVRGCGAWPRIADLAQCVLDLVEDRRILDRGRGRVFLAIGDPTHRSAQDLAGAGLGQA